MFEEFLRKAAELTARRQPFALAVVVRHEPPVSGKPGDKAIIQEDGSLAGWIGGGCTQPAIISEARRAIRRGRHRLVRIAPTSQGEAVEGLVEHSMRCHSGGSLEIYIEPVLPVPQLIILGRSTVARTLARLGKVMGYRIVAVSPSADSADFPQADRTLDRLDPSALQVDSRTFAIVATQGEDDEAALSAALGSGAGYVAFVASRRKAEAALEALRGEGVAPQDLERVRAPAGLDIAARLPEEIAVSVLAEIIGLLRQPAVETETDPVEEAQDPVCGMAVETGSARHFADHAGRRYYFCCAKCQRSFESDPAGFALSST